MGRPSLRLRLRLRLIPTTDSDTLVLATTVATPDSATEATPVLEVSTASVRLRPIPTTDTDTPELATLASGATEDTAVDTPALDTPDLATLVATLDSATDTAVATDTSDKKDPVLRSTKAFKTNAKQNHYS